MRKKLLVIITIIALLTITGCKNKKEDNKEQKVGGWELVLTDKQVNITDEELNIFNNASKKYNDLKLEPVALLAEQVVAGKNYMFFAKAKNEYKNETTYKMVVVYNDLKNNSSIKSVEDFDISKYAGEESPKKYSTSVGTWTINGTGKALMLDDEKVQYAFDNASSNMDSMLFNPICLIGKQIVSGTNYAILTYGKGANGEDDESVYVATIYENLDGESEMTYLYYINPIDFSN